MFKYKINNRQFNCIPVESIVAGALNLVTSMLNTASDSDSIEKQNEANLNLLAYQYDRNLDMWRRENEYNTPTNQMSRFAAAGLNPNLIYGQSNTSSAISAPSASPMRANTNHRIGQGIENSILQGMSYALQAQQTEANVKQSESQANLNDKNAELVSSKNELQTYTNAIEKIKLAQAEYLNASTPEEKSIWQKQIDLQFDMLQKDASIKESISEQEKIGVDIKGQQLSNLRAEYSNLMAKVDNILADTNLKRAQAKQAIYNALESAARTKLYNLQATGQEIKNELDRTLAHSIQVYGVDPRSGPAQSLIYMVDKYLEDSGITKFIDNELPKYGAKAIDWLKETWDKITN